LTFGAASPSIITFNTAGRPESMPRSPAARSRPIVVTSSPKPPKPRAT
jgi:hypothetical protein